MIDPRYVRSLAKGAALGVALSAAFGLLAFLLTTGRDYYACWHAPKVVPYHDGMTLCPGQSAKLTVILPFPAQDADDEQPKKDDGI